MKKMKNSSSTSEEELQKKKQDVMIGICGGVCPAAGILLHELILENTSSGGIDQGHLNVCHFSRSKDIFDSVKFLRSLSDHTDTTDTTNSSTTSVENPAIGMAKTFEMMISATMSSNSSSTSTNSQFTTSSNQQLQLVMGIPCSTFHVPVIWNEFIQLTKMSNYEQKGQVKCLHMLQETLLFIQQLDQSIKKIGLLSTTPTRLARIYHDLFIPYGYEILQVSEEEQEELHETILNPLWGIKTTTPKVNLKCLENFQRFTKSLQVQGAQVILMGCTEIPYIYKHPDMKKDTVIPLLVDPMVALARALIRETDPTRLKPLAYQTPVD